MVCLGIDLVMRGRRQLILELMRSRFQTQSHNNRIQAFVSAQDGKVPSKRLMHCGCLANGLYEALLRSASLHSRFSCPGEERLLFFFKNHFGSSEAEIYFSGMYRCQRYKVQSISYVTYLFDTADTLSLLWVIC